MAKSAKTRLPLAPEAREELLALIRSAAEPLPAKALAKLLAPAHRVAEADLMPILEEYVASGTLYSCPGKTAKGKPLYWNRDIQALGRAAALEELDRAEIPLAAKDFARKMPAAIRFTEVELVPFLEEQVQAGRLHVFPPATSKGKPRYWIRDILAYGRHTIRTILGEKGPQAEASLKKAIKGLSGAQFDQVIEAALAAGDVWRHPPIAKTKKSLLGIRPPSPEPYLRDVGRQLAEIVGSLIAANVPEADLRRALVQLLEATGVSFSSSSAIVGNHEFASTRQSPAIDMLGLMRRIEPGADRGALVGARDLRRAARMEKGLFDRTVLELARKGSLSLHRHDYAASLSPSERDELVSDGEGTYYVGMALRQSR